MSLALPDRPVLLTGASGMIGRELVRHFAPFGWDLRLTDIAPFPDPLPAGARFVQADLQDGAAILRIAEGCGTILHFGGIAVEQPFETVIGPNIRGTYHVYEAARREGARMVYASSNHTIGFHERGEVIDTKAELRADGYYGLSKIYAEMMGRLYEDKHGVPSIFLRIGSCIARPKDARMLATYLSFGDMARLAERCVRAEPWGTHPLIIWGVSANARMTWWRDDAREAIGWAPQDSADEFTEELQHIKGDPVAERYQGGGYCAQDYSRKG